MSQIIKGGPAQSMGQTVELSNPAQDQQAAQTRRRPRVPMSELRQRLQVPDIPGWRLYWFKDENIPAALDAYYEFVKRDEISTNPIGIGQSATDSGNTDLGTNVSIIAGQNAAGQPVRLNLMKLKMEYFKEDQASLEHRNAMIMASIFGQEAMIFGSSPNPGDGRHPDTDTSKVYKKTALYNRPVRKAQRLVRTVGGPNRTET